MRTYPAVSGPLQTEPTALEIALVSEGTYPFYTGGVSGWCHQLIEGMPDSNFHVIAVSVTGLERSIWAPLPNMTSMTNLPLWGTEPVTRKKHREVLPGWFEKAHLTFFQTLADPKVSLTQRPVSLYDNFLDSLQAMFRYAQEADLSAALLSNDAIERMMDFWQNPQPEENPTSKNKPNITLADALTVASLLEHVLRPLSAPPPKVDLVHSAMNGLSTLIGMTAKWTYGTPFIMSEHGIYLRERYLSYMNDPVSYPVKMLMLNFFRLLTSSAYRIADIVAPHSRYNRRWELHNGADASQLRTMYNGVDPSEFTPDWDETEEPTIVFVGRIDPLKDLHTLIRSLSIAQKTVPKARLRIFGPVPDGNEGYYKSCIDLIKQLGLEDSVSFEGRVAHPRDAYRVGQVVVLSSISEGFPYTVIEAMASGRATVSTNVGGVSEGVGRAGIVVPPRDPAAMAAACVRLLVNPKLRKRLGVAARERVLQKFTLEQSIRAYRLAYAEAMTGVYYTEEEPEKPLPLEIKAEELPVGGMNEPAQ